MPVLLHLIYKLQTARILIRLKIVFLHSTKLKDKELSDNVPTLFGSQTSFVSLYCDVLKFLIDLILLSSFIIFWMGSKHLLVMHQG